MGENAKLSQYTAHAAVHAILFHPSNKPANSSAAARQSERDRSAKLSVAACVSLSRFVRALRVGGLELVSFLARARASTQRVSEPDAHVGYYETKSKSGCFTRMQTHKSCRYGAVRFCSATMCLGARSNRRPIHHMTRWLTTAATLLHTPERASNYYSKHLITTTCRPWCSVACEAWWRFDVLL